MDQYSPIRGKCVWWREVPNPEDLYNPDVRAAEKRIDCSCFVEGYRWAIATAELPIECPRNRECRYYVKGY